MMGGGRMGRCMEKELATKLRECADFDQFPGRD